MGVEMTRDPHKLVDLEIPIVLQPIGSCLCQAACVAMITRLTLRTVRKHVKLHRIRRGKGAATEVGKEYLSDHEATRFLLTRGWLTGCWPMFGEDGTQLSAGDLAKSKHGVTLHKIDDWPGILAVKSEKIEGSIHAVVWDKVRRMVLDPHYEEPKPLQRYIILEWIPVVPYTPTPNNRGNRG